MRLLYNTDDDLSKAPVVQDPNGVYFWNGSSYYEPSYKDWDNGIIPVGYSRYSDGSHSIYNSFYWNGVNHKQLAWDLFMPSWTILRADVDVKIEYIYGNHTVSSGYLLISFTDGTNQYVALLGHAYTDNQVGQVISAGEVIAKTNGSMGHLHLAGIKNNQTFDIAEIFLKEPKPLPSFDINQNIELVADTNLRANAGLNSDITGLGVSGAIGTITSKAILVDDFNWQSVRFVDGEGFMYTGNMQISNKPSTKLNGQPTDDCNIRLKEVEAELLTAHRTIEGYESGQLELERQLNDLSGILEGERVEAENIRSYNQELLKKLDEDRLLMLDYEELLKAKDKEIANEKNTSEQLKKVNEELKRKGVEKLSTGELLKLIISRIFSSKLSK